ncbi:MAG TPA: histidine phosphatase family protein [Fibrobacteraceae bacterium]|nr:histidine phosphatase family protein [Fibrobacteraceae bacterium]
MERTLYLIRHAPAEDAALSGTRDYDRALTFSGRELANRQAEQLLERGARLDGLIGSTAVRAWQTAEVVANVLHLPESRCVKWPILYSAKVQELVAVRVSKSWGSVALVGHNPPLTEMAKLLLKNSAEALPGEIPMAGILGISFPTNQWLWPRSGSLALQLFPDE